MRATHGTGGRAGAGAFSAGCYRLASDAGKLAAPRCGQRTVVTKPAVEQGQLVTEKGVRTTFDARHHGSSSIGSAELAGPVPGLPWRARASAATAAHPIVPFPLYENWFFSVIFPEYFKPLAADPSRIVE